MRALRGLTWTTLGVIALTIVWGAYVRASGSGAGCGSHWPLCNGQVLPSTQSLQTRIEFIHRLSSALSIVLVFALSLGIWRSIRRRELPEGIAQPLGRYAVLISVCIIVEALIGAALVVFELVGFDRSLKRTFSIAAHFVNTLVLLYGLMQIALFLRPAFLHQGWKAERDAYGRIFLTSLALVGIAGSITALGDTLFPATSLQEGMAQDWASGAHFLIRLRVLHPLLATAFVVGSLAWVGEWLRSPLPVGTRKTGQVLMLVLVGNLSLGLTNLLLLAPIWLQLVHLSTAVGLWMLGTTWVHFIERSGFADATLAARTH